MAKENSNHDNALTKERLKYYRSMPERIEIQEERLQRLKSKMLTPTSQIISDMPRGASDGDKIGRQLENIEVLEEKIRELKSAENQEKYQIEQAIDELESPYEQIVLQMRYIDRYEWEEICEILYGNHENYFENEDAYQRKIYRLHKNGIVHLQRIIKNKL